MMKMIRIVVAPGYYLIFVIVRESHRSFIIILKGTYYVLEVY